MRNPLTVLIVEDNPKSMKLCRDLLELHGHMILEATDGREGVNMARLHRPDLIVMDIQLPVMSGMDAARILREKKETQAIPIIASTAFAMKGDEERFLRNGFNAYIPKPINTRTFAEDVEAVYEAANAEKAEAP